MYVDSIHAFIKNLRNALPQRQREVDITGLMLLSSRLMLPAEPGD